MGTLLECFDQHILLVLFSNKVHGSLGNYPWMPLSIKGTPAKKFSAPNFPDTISSQSSNLGGLLDAFSGWQGY